VIPALSPYLLLIFPALDAVYLYLRIQDSIKLKEDRLFINLIACTLEFTLSMCLISSTVYLALFQSIFLFILYYFIVFFYTLCVLLVHLFSSIPKVVREPLISLKEDLEFNEDPLPLIYTVVTAALWPVGRFVFIKPLAFTLSGK
jgi:hypothetical protein